METFCETLHKRTKDIHDTSDKLVNLKLLIALTDAKLYGSVLVQFYEVYKTLETALEESRDDGRVAPLIQRQLFRTDAFEKDLAFYLGPDWSKQVTSAPEVVRYCQRIKDVTATEPYLLIAYAHSMYLAVLAGGKILRRIIKNTMDLPEGEGLHIFDVENSEELKKTFKNNINQIELSDGEKEKVIMEKRRVFEMNNDIARTVKVHQVRWLQYAIMVIVLVIAVMVYFLANALYF